MYASTALSLAYILVSPVLATFLPPHVARSPSPACQCDISNALLPVPANQTAIVRPASPPSFIGLGVGIQNYTCSAATSTYTSIGAVAELFDMSCLNGTPEFLTIQIPVYKAWISAPPSVTPAEIATYFDHLSAFRHLGTHYFITNPITGVGISPKWDFTSASFAGNPNAFVVGAKVGDIPAPTGHGDVDWLSLNAIQGELAKQVFRVETKGGQPPASCTPGSAPITVKYVSQYWLYGSSL